MACAEQNYRCDEKGDDKGPHLPNQEVKNDRAFTVAHHFWRSSTRRALQESW
jgi:hypothetical protein